LRLKHASFDMRAQSFQRAHKFLVKPFAQFGRRGFDEAGAPLAACVAIESELRHNESGSFRVEEREIHFAAGIIENSQVGDFFGHRGCRRRRVFAPDRNENCEACGNFARHRVIYRHMRAYHALKHSSHGLILEAVFRVNKGGCGRTILAKATGDAYAGAGPHGPPKTDHPTLPMAEPAIASSEKKSQHWLTRSVLGIGLASLFSDWGHEAASSILPAFLASLGAPPIALGVIEGVSDGLSSFAKLAGGWIAERPQLRKPTAVAGYVATGFSTFGYAFARTWPEVLVLRGLGWIGRGSRGPSRDTLLAGCVAPGQEGRAFGFERAMDTIGAVMGPLCAAALIGLLGMRGVMRWSLLPGLAAAIAFAVLAPASNRVEGHHAPSFATSFAQLPKRYWQFLAGVFAHGVGDFAPTLLILRATQLLSPRLGFGRAATAAVALYTFHNFVEAVATYPAGAFGDRMSKRVLLASGYLVGVITYAGFIFIAPTIAALAALFALAGIHDAFQASLEKSLAAELLPAEIRGSGFGMLAAFNGIGDLISSVVVGALWSAASPAAGFYYAGFFALAGAILIFRCR